MIVRNAAGRRRSLIRDSFATATQDIIATDLSVDLYYHTDCHSRFCAVKRKTHEDENCQSIAPKTMRSQNSLPKSDRKGVLMSCCIFCSAERKRKSSGGGGDFEVLSKVETMESSGIIINAAKLNPGLETSQRVLALGSEDLVAIAAHYHNSCRLKFLREATESGESSHQAAIMSNRKKHDETFKVFAMHIQSEIIDNRVPKYVSKLMELYKEQYRVIAGDGKDLEFYPSQALTCKIKSKFGDTLILGKESNKGGSFFLPSGHEH